MSVPPPWTDEMRCFDVTAGDEKNHRGKVRCPGIAFPPKGANGMPQLDEDDKKTGLANADAEIAVFFLVRRIACPRVIRRVCCRKLH
jgi:hypothetical protein